MIKKYVYNNQTYSSAYAVKQAIFEAERIAFGVEPAEGKAEFWAQYGVTYSEEEAQVKEPTTEEKAIAIREQRDRLISETDFYMMADYPASPEGLVAVKAYRQALRDITTQETFPESVTWPDMPVVLTEIEHVSQ